MQLPSLNTPKILNTKGKKGGGGEREETAPCINTPPWSLTPKDSSFIPCILSAQDRPSLFHLKLDKTILPRTNIFTYKELSVYDFCGSRKNLVAFMCLPKELILWEATSWLLNCSVNSGPFLAALHPKLGLPPRERKLQIHRLCTSHWSRQESMSIPEVTCPSHLPWVLPSERVKLKPCKRLLIYSRKFIQVTVTKG